MARLPEHPAPHLTPSGPAAGYLAAWLCGGVFLALSVFVAAPAGDARGALVVLFAVLAYAGIVMPPFAFLLRLMARQFRCERPWPWAICGGVLAALVAAACSLLSARWMGAPDWPRFLAELFELHGANGASLFSRNTLACLATILGGMATGTLLFRMDRAFSRDASASN
jgi:hypothetical protein